MRKYSLYNQELKGIGLATNQEAAGSNPAGRTTDQQNQTFATRITRLRRATRSSGHCPGDRDQPAYVMPSPPAHPRIPRTRGDSLTSRQRVGFTENFAYDLLSASYGRLRGNLFDLAIMILKQTTAGRASSYGWDYALSGGLIARLRMISCRPFSRNSSESMSRLIRRMPRPCFESRLSPAVGSETRLWSNPSP